MTIAVSISNIKVGFFDDNKTINHTNILIIKLVLETIYTAA